jgi:hypothetical protein
MWHSTTQGWPANQGNSTKCLRLNKELVITGPFGCDGTKAFASASVRVESLVYTVGVIGPSQFAGAVGMRSRASRRRLSDNDIRCSASDRRWFPARPAQHVHRRRNNAKGRIPSPLASAHDRNGKRPVETCNAGRAGAHRPSEALHPTRSSDVLPRIARERVPTVPHVAKTRLLRRRYANTPTRRHASLAGGPF